MYETIHLIQGRRVASSCEHGNLVFDSVRWHWRHSSSKRVSSSQEALCAVSVVRIIWLNVTVELIKCLLFIGSFLVHISAGYPDCGVSWHSSTLSSKSRITQSVPLSAEPIQASSVLLSMASVAVACIRIYYACWTTVREYEVQYDMSFIVETYSRKKNHIKHVISNLEVDFSVLHFEHRSTSTGQRFHLAFSYRRSEREHLFFQEKR